MQRSYDQAPTLRAGLIALLVTLTIGFLINDSGVAIPAVGATLAVPLIVSVSVSYLLDEARSAAPDPLRTPAAMTTTHSTSPTHGTTPRRTPSVRSSTAGVMPSTRPGT